jgi:hypothetical protein
VSINKAFVVKNSFEVSTDLVLANADTRKVGIAITNPRYLLDVAGGIGATDFYLTGIGTFVDELNVGLGGTVLTVLGIGNSIGIGTALPQYLLDIRSPVSTGQTALYIQGDVEITGSILFNNAELLNTTTQDLNVIGISSLNNVFLEGYVSAGNTTGQAGQVLISTGVGVTWKDTSTFRTTTAFTATLNQNVFPVQYAIGQPIDVFLNGVKLSSSEFGATNGTDVILPNLCFGGETVEIISYEFEFPLSFSGVTIQEEGSVVGTGVNMINFIGSAVTAVSLGAGSTIFVNAQLPLTSSSEVEVGIITTTLLDSLNGNITNLSCNDVDVSGIVTATGGFVSTANTTPITIGLIGNLLTFNAVGIGSTTFILF